jgi:hypothetical protein
MTWKCERWVRPMLPGMSLVVALAMAPLAWGQGYGPDPFKPFNSQYDPYTYPMGSASPDGGQSAGMNASGGLRGANQYQNYLNALEGAGRSSVEKYGIGMPYYRAAVDASFNRKNREYQPNRQSKRTFEEIQQVVTDKYLAFFEERDPKRREKLYQDYTFSRARFDRALASRRAALPSSFEAAGGLGRESRAAASSAERANSLAAPLDRDARSADDDPLGRLRSRPGSTRGTGTLGIPVAPPIPRAGSRTGSTRRTPNDVLNRAQGLGDTPDQDPGTAAAPTPNRDRAKTKRNRLTVSPLDNP